MSCTISVILLIISQNLKRIKFEICSLGRSRDILASSFGVTPLKFWKDLWHHKGSSAIMWLFCVILRLGTLRQCRRVTDGQTHDDGFMCPTRGQNLKSLAQATWEIFWGTKNLKWITWCLHAPFRDSFPPSLGLAMINLHTKFEVSTFTHYKDMKGNAKCRNSGILGVRG